MSDDGRRKIKKPSTVGQILESKRRSVWRVEDGADDNGSPLKNLFILIQYYK